ncbi:MAG: hypothetical protein Q9216_005815 [Gyalolechia sp. 2 TL-2023]
MLALTLTADLVGVTELLPLDTAEEPFFYTFKVQCTSCREIHPNWVSISRFVGVQTVAMATVPEDSQESTDISGSKGEANFVWRCKACKRESTASMKDAPRAYTQASPPTRQTIIEIDCRGLEFTEFRAEGEWMAKGLESSTKFSAVDLQEGEWFDYDEKSSEEVDSANLTIQFHTNNPRTLALALTKPGLTTFLEFYRSLRLKVVRWCSRHHTRIEIDNLAGLDVDGPAELEFGPMHTRRRRLGGDVCTIFVHAGAGYHSVQNERIHLQACEQAAKAAMSLLSEGGGAVDAVEMAIMVLEEQEITNAGYGSNLSLDGTVECDATLVDHHGRSGAVGAVSQIQHPIHLARLILDYSTKPLSLRRVPPNLLAGPGATDFAESLQLPVLPHDCLISESARSRWLKWAQDLKAADSKEDEGDEPFESSPAQGNPYRNQQSGDLPPYHTHEDKPYTMKAAATLSHTSTSKSKHPEVIDEAATPPYERMCMDAANTPTPHHIKWAGQWQRNDGGPGRELREDNGDFYVDDNPPMTRPVPSDAAVTSKVSSSRSEMAGGENYTLAAIPPPVLENNPILQSKLPVQAPRAFSSGNDAEVNDPVCLNDDITDTVGAIAIDCLGNIAAGSSSGGIGMKHRGRIGPAALVGVGTAVVPVDADDADRTSVATVTSGTGEHMATTMAASVCANRLYTGTRKNRQGGSESTDDDSAVKSFVERDFMGHPSVKNSYSAGAIGVLGVKKTNDGVWLYFAHNTDSFAMASMSSEESKPRSVMSRSKDSGRVVSGGRSIKYRRVTSWPPGHHSGWPASAEASSSPEQPAKRQKRKRVVPSGLPPDPEAEEDPSNVSYKAVYETKMREVYGADPEIEEEIAGMALRSQRSEFEAYTPLVASDACSRKTASPASLATSMGMARRWQAKIAFVRGMYWEEREPETERMRMRVVREGFECAVVVVGAVVLLLSSEEEGFLVGEEEARRLFV